MPDELTLVFPTQAHKGAIWAYRQEHIDAGETWIHDTGGLIEAVDFESWLEKIQTARTASQTGWVNCRTYFSFVNGRIVGAIQIRESLNEQLALALNECRSLGLQKVLLTCDTDNIASAKTIRKNGGAYQDEIFDEEDGTFVSRYRITLE